MENFIEPEMRKIGIYYFKIYSLEIFIFNFFEVFYLIFMRV